MYKLLSFILIVMFLLSGCASKKEPVSETQRAQGMNKGVSQKILQFDLTAYTDRGIKRWEVSGESADVIGDVVELADIVAKTYDEKNPLMLKADKGIYNKALNKIRLRKNVIITTSDGARVLTYSMNWNTKNNIITTNDLVEIEREKIKLWGKGAKGEPELRKVRFEKEIKIEMDNGATIVTCEGPLNIDYEKNLAIFNNNVKIVDEKGEVNSNRLDAHLNPETKTIKKAIARGAVKILRNENYSYSDEAIYFADEHRVLLIGKPEIVIYPDKKLDASLFGMTNDK